MIKKITCPATWFFIFNLLLSITFGQGIGKDFFSSKEKKIFLNTEKILSHLKSISQEKKQNDKFWFRSGEKSIELEFPVAELEKLRFIVYETPVLPPMLASKYPSIKTFSGYNIDSPSEQISITILNDNFTADILTSTANISIKSDGINKYTIKIDGGEVASAERNDIGYVLRQEQNQISKFQNLACINSPEPCYPIGNKLFLYRWAIVLSKEANAIVGGSTKTGGLAWVAGLVNKCNLVWNRDISSKIILPEKEDTLIFTDNNFGYFPSPPFSGSTSFLLQYVETTINPLIGTENYEYGHLIHNGIGGGWAYVAGRRGISDPSYEVFVHEIGHQIGSSHNIVQEGPENGWSVGGTIMGNRESNVATIDGIKNGDQYSCHTISQAIEYQRTRTDFMKGWYSEPNSNNLPIITLIPENTNIPKLTPFVLTGEAKDSDNNNLTYSWEQNDKSQSTYEPGNAPPDNGPLFCTVFPSLKGNTRYFPNLTDILENRKRSVEQLPFSKREMNFRFIVRDNNTNGGGYVYKSVKLSVDGNSGPFKVLTGIEPLIWDAGSKQKIIWDPANTDKSPVNCSKVDILLSTDGGKNFDIKLAENALNNGSCEVNLPEIISSNCRIMIKAVNNIFFDINDNKITLFDNKISGINLDLSKYSLNVSSLDTVNIEIKTQGLGIFKGNLFLSVANQTPGSRMNFDNGRDTITIPADSKIKLYISNMSNVTHGIYTNQVMVSGGGLNITKILKIVKTSQISKSAGKAVSFNRNNSDNIQLPAFGFTSNNFSFCAWIKLNGAQSSYSVLFCTDAADKTAAFNFKEGNQLGYHWPGDGSYSWDGGPIVPENQWTHVAMVVKQDSMTIYMNGVPVTHNVYMEPVNFNSSIRLGSYKLWNSRYFNGEMDEVSFWNKSLSNSEVWNLFFSPPNGSEDGLVAYYQFNNNSPEDLIGNYEGTQNRRLTYTNASFPFGNSSINFFDESENEINSPAEGIKIKYTFQKGVKTYIAKINNAPSNYEGISSTESPLSSQYWILGRTGTTPFIGDFTFRINDSLPLSIVKKPEVLHLYTRAFSSSGVWLPKKDASSYSSSAKEVTFKGIYVVGELLITGEKSSLKTEMLTSIPERYALYQNYPNPFNPSTNIYFDLPKISNVKVEIFDLLGRRVKIIADQKYNAGKYSLQWYGDDSNGNSVKSGTYFYRILAGEFSEIKKMILLR